MAKKIYAVQKGKKTGIFNTWEECQKQINGFSGAIYKSFKTTEKDLAKKFIQGDKTVKSLKNIKFYTVIRGNKTGVFDTWELAKEAIEGFSGAKYKSFKNKEMAELAFKNDDLNIMSVLLEKEFKEKYDIVIFTDGGANKDKIGAFAFLILEIKNNEIINKKTFSEGFTNVTNNRMEMSSVLKSLQYLDENYINTKIGFYIDSKFTIDSIKNKFNQTVLKDISDILYPLYDKVLSKNESLDLNHVNSHIGLQYNEEVDTLLNLEKENIYKKIEENRILLNNPS